MTLLDSQLLDDFFSYCLTLGKIEPKDVHGFLQQFGFELEESGEYYQLKLVPALRKYLATKKIKAEIKFTPEAITIKRRSNAR